MPARVCSMRFVPISSERSTRMFLTKGQRSMSVSNPLYREEFEKCVFCPKSFEEAIAFQAYVTIESVLAFRARDAQIRHEK